MFLILPTLLACTPLEEMVPVLYNEDACAPARFEPVACVLDGDTIDIGACGDEGERIRFLGVAAPEIAHAGSEEECFGDEAHAFLEEILTDKSVQLSFDKECQGIYGRTLAWVSLDLEDVFDDYPYFLVEEGFDADQKLLVNELLIAYGYARRYDEAFATDILFFDRLGKAEEYAKEHNFGLWAECE